MKRLLVLSAVVVIAALVVFAIPGSTALADTPAPGGPFSSAFRVQNLGSSDATCTFSFYDSAGTAVYTSAPSDPIAPGSSLYVYVPDISGLAAGQYAGVVSCDQPVAAVVNFSDPNSGASHAGVSSPGTIWYAPGIYDNYYGYYSVIIAQNASANPVDITVEIFEPGNTTPVYSSTATNVPANAAVSFEQEGLAELADNQFYSAKISATGDIAPIVNIYGLGGVDNQLYSYNPFKSGSTTAYAPVVMNNYYGNNTALVIQNLGSNAADVTVTYSNGWSQNYTIQPGAAESLYTPNQSGIPAGNTLYGATVTSTNSEPIVVLVNESNSYNRAASYSGFSSGATTVQAPIVMRRYYEYNTSITCQNLGSSATTMSIQYGGISGTSTSDPVNPGDTWMFYQPSDNLIPDNFIGSATITSAEPIVCVVNEDKNENPVVGEDMLYSYEGIGQ